MSTRNCPIWQQQARAYAPPFGQPTQLWQVGVQLVEAFVDDSSFF